MAATLGADYPVLMNAMDRVINGEQGAGREAYEQFLPTAANRILSGALRTDPNSQFGATWMQSVAQMEAAGAIDGITGADAGEKQQFFDTLSAQVRNNMWGRVLFGLWAPASPMLPENTVTPEGLAPVDRADYGTDEAYQQALADRAAFDRQGQDADWSFHKAGLNSLKSQARKVFAELPYEEAMEWWVKNHPGELILAPGVAGTTKVGDLAGAANAPATLAAAKWMENNAELLRDYPGVAVYLMPQGNPDTENGDFSQVAYNSQLEQGIRVKKELMEFLDDVIIKRGEGIYYDTKDDYDAAIAQARRMGDEAAVDSLEAQWLQEKQLIEATNPLFAAKNASYAENEVLRQQQILDLGRLMNDPRAYQAMGDQALGIERLADAYAAYQRARDALSGARGPEAQRQRAQLADQYRATVDAVVGEFPGLSDLARGIFRIPSN
jgi:hypothetical protein